MRIVKLHALVAIGLCAGPLHAASSDNVRAWLGRKDVAVEAAVRTLVVATIASGEGTLGQCFHDQYFGSPLKQRNVLGAVWTSEAAAPYEAMADALKRACRYEASFPQPLVPEDKELWSRTGNGTVLLELGEYYASGADAAAGMLAAAFASSDEPMATCIEEQRAGGALKAAVYAAQDQPLSIAVHDELRARCGLHAGHPPAASLSFPVMPNTETVARERLLIIQDGWACSRTSHVGLCLNARYKERARVLWPQLLRNL